ncbi:MULTISPECIES: hypothetical protein [unclassified Geodermatophilus]|uniref:hypothetical protein n=1 Tax=unclassified Geodermatophilus TaxID=2637632 RepID=UPI003EED061F
MHSNVVETTPASSSVPPAAYPQAPIFTASVDQTRGAIRTRGHLDRVGAELLCGTVLALERCGHRHITVLIRPPATVDPDAARLLADLADRLAADGVRLEVGT